jgi:hypothetical protein
MKNDFERAFFTLNSFRRHHPNTPIRVINAGGKDPSKYLSSIGVEIIHADDLWHKKTLCGVGSFGPRYYDYLFEYGLNSNYSHTLYLETDVLTNRKISITPKYELSGPNNPCGHNEFVLYEYLNIHDNFLHTGCGGTMFSYNYFKTISENNFKFFQDIFDKFAPNYFMDLISTLAARVHGLSFGHWEEVSNIPIHVIDNKFVNVDMNATLIHNFKV